MAFAGEVRKEVGALLVRVCGRGGKRLLVVFWGRGEGGGKLDK